MTDRTPTTFAASGRTASLHATESFLRRHLVALVAADETGEPGGNILVTRLPFLVGRGSRATMAIAHETVSRRHAQIRLGAGGQLELVDVGSSNGSWVNGERVDECVLDDGDELRFGSVAFRLVVEDRGPMTVLHD